MNKTMKQSKKRILYPLLSAAVLLVCSLCFCSARWFVTTYGRTGFDSILYTLQSSLSGVQSGLLWKYILQGALPAVVFTAVLVAVLFLQILVLRALFGSEIENYRLLANIGLTCATAKRSILWQVLLFTALGQGVGFAALLYCDHIGIERIVSIMRYLPAELMAVLSAVHLAAAVAAALVIGGAVRKRIYPLVKKQDDIRLDEEVAV